MYIKIKIYSRQMQRTAMMAVAMWAHAFPHLYYQDMTVPLLVQQFVCIEDNRPTS